MSAHPTISAARVANGLRDWAYGSHAMTAAVELLTRAFDRRFARPDQPWIRVEPSGWVWLDDDLLHASLGPLSGGERRVLDVVCALVEPVRTIPLADTLAGLDRTNLDLVLAACAHAAGSHEQAEVVYDLDTLKARLSHLGPAHPWPPPRESTPSLAVPPPCGLRPDPAS